MLKLSFKQSFASLPSMQPLYDLALRCEQADGFPSKIYWHALNDRKEDLNALDYLCYHDDKLIAMLNILFFSESVEITALVDPEYRRQGVFRKLLHIALIKLRQYILTHYTFICNEKARTLIEKHLQQGAVEDHFEIEMLAPEIVKNSGKQKLQLQKAEIADIPILANIHEQCFKQPSAEAMEKRFAVTLLESNRRVYLAKNSDGIIIGKIHAREDFNRICLHDVGILPAYQRQGFGFALMAEWIKQYSKDYQKPIIVEVLGDNIAAMELYKSCGFRLINTHRFYKFPFKG